MDNLQKLFDEEKKNTQLTAENIQLKSQVEHLAAQNEELKSAIIAYFSAGERLKALVGFSQNDLLAPLNTDVPVLSAQAEMSDVSLHKESESQIIDIESLYSHVLSLVNQMISQSVPATELSHQIMILLWEALEKGKYDNDLRFMAWLRKFVWKITKTYTRTRGIIKDVDLNVELNEPKNVDSGISFADVLAVMKTWISPILEKFPDDKKALVE